MRSKELRKRSPEMQVFCDPKSRSIGKPAFPAAKSAPICKRAETGARSVGPKNAIRVLKETPSPATTRMTQGNLCLCLSDDLRRGKGANISGASGS